jgi:signal transduction histidine kinase
VVVDDQDPRSHGLLALIGTSAPADKRDVRQESQDSFQAWLWGQTLVFGLLGAALALFLSRRLQTTYRLPELRLVLQTASALAGFIIAVLAGVRFSVEGRRLDLLLSCGFFVAAMSTLAFGIAPLMGGQPLHRPEAWAGVVGRLLAWTLIASAPFLHGRTASRERALGNATLAGGVLLLLSWSLLRSLGPSLPPLTPHGGDGQPPLFTGALAAQALLNLLALVGFGLRFRARGEDLDRWLGLGSTLMLFASLHYVFTPLLSSEYVSQGDFLRVLAYAVLLVGAWRAIRFSEFGRAVAEERARVAREIHDGLAQYLFAVSTQVNMLESGVPRETVLPRLKEAASAAQQEARFAIMALSSASGNAPFDAALRRYVEFLTADGSLDVHLEIDKNILLAPDEQIEVFRIVQEGLGNVRKHANATRAEVVIAQRAGRRSVSVRDDGDGFDGEPTAAGQGLKNIRARAASIDGGFTLTSAPGVGTALEVVLR